MREFLAACLLATPLLLGLSGGSALAVCDLSQVVGYTLVFGKTIEAYMDDGKRVPGFTGCTRYRVLVFADNTVVRCKDTFFQTAQSPKGYLFARNPDDMKLCVDNAMYDVAQAE